MAVVLEGDGLPRSIFVADDAEVHVMPVSAINRPLQSTVCEDKVQDFMSKIQTGVELTPIEVAWVETDQGNYYFSFGGCHRWEAHKRLNSETITARLIKVAPSVIRTYLGSSSPF